MTKRHKWVRPKELRRLRQFEAWRDDTFGILFSETTNTCPHCGGRAIIPRSYLSSTMDKSILNQHSKTCHLIACIDEGRSTVGYHVVCKQGLHSCEWLAQNRKIFYECLQSKI